MANVEVADIDSILVAAYDLKRPLTDLRQLALALDGIDGDNQLIREQMVHVSERSLRQVNDLIKMRKLEKEMPEMEPVAIRLVCNDVTREMDYLFKANQRELSVRYLNRTPLVTANRELLKSVIYNFLLSAAHYSGNETRAELTVRDVHNCVKISIRDYGPALPMDVWREMKRGWLEKPTSITMRPGTSGLGLFIASRFSWYMNARVGAVRHRDGTSFFVELNRAHQLSIYDMGL